MSASTHHIQSVRYNRSLQFTPKSRVSATFKAIESSLRGRTSYGAEVIDDKSSTERRAISSKIRKARIADIINFVAAIIIFISLVVLAIYLLNVV